MMFLKGCPKCKGDLLVDEDTYGKYVSCLQCGFMQDLVEHQRVTREAPVAKQVVAA
jgi:hypothetical protein